MPKIFAGFNNSLKVAWSKGNLGVSLKTGESIIKGTEYSLAAIATRIPPLTLKEPPLFIIALEP
jgi:hypothetical protein